MKQSATKMTKEEEDFLAEEAKKAAETPKPMPQMKQLAINSDRVDDKGNKVDADTWYIREEGGYVDTIKFRPLRHVSKFIRMVQEGKQWKNQNESIFVTGFEPAYDINGTVGCGRIMGRFPAHWTEEDKQVNFKKATIYSYLFGLVTFPGQEPKLVNFRASPAKAKVVRAALSTEALGVKKLYGTEFQLKLTPIKGEKFPQFDMTEVKNSYRDSFSDVIPYIRECDAFIDAHNKRIMQQRERLQENVKAASTYKEVESLANDFVEGLE